MSFVNDSAYKLAQEAAFRRWYDQVATLRGLSPNPNDPLHFYDYRAAFAAGARPDAYGHMPSQYKTIGHPRLILDGVDTRNGLKASPALIRQNQAIYDLTVRKYGRE